MALVVDLGVAFQTLDAHVDIVGLRVDVVTYHVDPDAPEQGMTLVEFNRAKIAHNPATPATVTHNGTACPTKRIGEGGLCPACLQAVTLSDGLEEIGKIASYSNSTDDLVILDSVVNIGEWVFMNNHMKAVVLPKKLAEIKVSTFVNNNLTSTDLLIGLTIIGPAVSASCRLASLVLSESVTSAGTSAFGTNVLTSVIIPKGLTLLAVETFSNNKLTLAEILETVISLGSEVLVGNKLTSLKPLKSVTTIPGRAFHSSALTSVTLPEGLTEIQEATFEYSNLILLTIPAKTITIAKRAFGGNAPTPVRMKGPVPSIHTPGRWSPNVDFFGDPRDLEVSYYCHLSDDYARPTWSGHTLAGKCTVVTAKGGGAAEPAKLSFDPNADNDDDGFTNGEEVEAETDLFDPASYPARSTPFPSSIASPAPTPVGTTSQAAKPTRPGLLRTEATNS